MKKVKRVSVQDGSGHNQVGFGYEYEEGLWRAKTISGISERLAEELTIFEGEHCTYKIRPKW